jgi:hypothetical protein
MIDIDYMLKTNKAEQIWIAFPEEIKTVLNIAFHDALRRPEYVAEYVEKTYKISNTTMTVYYFRIGYAAFKLVLAQGIAEYILADLDFRDGDEAFEALRPAAI